MNAPIYRALVLPLLVLALLGAASWSAMGAPADEYLSQATEATGAIRLAGDQSAALQSIARVSVELSPERALDLVVRMRRPSDAARSLGAAAVALRQSNPELSGSSVTTAGRLLLRIPDGPHRFMEQTLVLRETASLGADALPAAPELAPSEAQYVVARTLAETDARAALALVARWQLTGRAADEVLAAATRSLAADDVEAALLASDKIMSVPIRDEVLWRLCERRPAGEVAGLALRISDGITRAAALAGAAARLAKTDVDAALVLAGMVEVARESARAEVAVAAATSERGKALAIARGLSPRPRAWALTCIAVRVAATEPEEARRLLAEADAVPEATCLAIGEIAVVEPRRAVDAARALPPGEGRDSALAIAVRAIAPAEPELARQLVWEIASSPWRGLAVESAALSQADTDLDAATSLIGLVDDGRTVSWIRSRVALTRAPGSASLAQRLLGSLPISLYRIDAAVGAAALALAAGAQVSTAADLGALGPERDLALRWALPSVALAQTRSPSNLAGEISDPYLRAMALADVASDMLHLQSRAQLAPDRMRSVRMIAEWAER